MTKYRVDRANEIAELMDQVREAYDQAEADGLLPSRTGVTFESTRVERVRDHAGGLLQAKAPQKKRVSVNEQYTDNLVAAQYAAPEAFGRSRLGQHRVIVKIEELGAGRDPLGSPAAARQAREGESAPDLPLWVTQPVAYDEAVRLIEDVARVAFLHAPTHVAAGSAARQHTADFSPTPTPAPHPDDRFEAPPAPLPEPAPELTNPAFAWRPGESYFEQYAAGAVVVSGEGAEFVDRERTSTFFGRPY